MEKYSITDQGMSKPSTIRSLIELWPSRREMAADVSVPFDEVTAERVHGWVKSGSIPARYHRRIVLAAQKRGLAVDADLLADLHHCIGKVGKVA